MGYFANGTEGDMYEEEFCSRCVHYGDMDKDELCPVWEAHLLYSYDDCNKPESILHILIPRDDLTGDNEQCRMFVERSKA